MVRPRSETGFTLIEVLIVVIIIGILAAIAIPQIASSRRRAFEATVKSDLKMPPWHRRPTTPSILGYQDAPTATAASLPGFGPSTEVTISIAVLLDNQFTLSAVHAACGATTWSFNNLTGIISNSICP